MRIDLLRGDAARRVPLKSAVRKRRRTDRRRRSWKEPSCRRGPTSIVFHVGEYFRDRGHPDAGRFLEEVPVVFVVDEPAGSYHVPLLVSPWSYSTYRGS